MQTTKIENEQIEYFGYCDACGADLSSVEPWKVDEERHHIKVSPCQKCMDAAQNEGYKEGYDEGKDDGYKDGYKEGYNAKEEL